MMIDELLPYFHPTQAILVDDDINFLGNLSLQLDAELAYLLFDSTEKALDFINDRKTGRFSRKRFFDLKQPAGGPVDAPPPPSVGLDVAALGNELFYTDRFSQLSVVMVDYAMPRLNGIELCQRIDDPNVKKILFTGVATKCEAVEAFNDGVIDCYIGKNEPNVYDKLNRNIQYFQQQYIGAMFDAAGELFDVDMPPLLSNPRVLALMQQLAAKYRVVEYFLTEQPDGFILVDADGRSHRLVLADEPWFAAQAVRARELGAAADQVHALNHDKRVINPVLLRDAAQPEAVAGWQANCQPTQPIKGEARYRWAVFEHPWALADDRPAIASFNEYLQWIDTVGYSLM